MPDEPADAAAYDLAPDPVGPSRQVRRSVPAAPVIPAGPIATGPRQPTLDYQRPPAGGAGRTAPAEPEAIRNLYAPMWLLGGGVLVEVVAAFLRARDLAAALRYVGLSLVVGTAIMLAGILIAARARGIDLGRFWTAVFKLAAISVVPSAAATLADPMLRYVPFGSIVSLVGQFVLYFALIGLHFDLDQSDTWYCVCVIFLVRLTVYFGLIYLL